MRMSFASARRSHPERWLFAAVVFDLASYRTASGTLGFGVWFWVLSDLWLTRRIWKGGHTARTVFWLLQMVTACFGAVALAMEPFVSNFSTGATPLSVALLAVSAWCLSAPALERHVRQRGEAPASALA